MNLADMKANVLSCKYPYGSYRFLDWYATQLLPNSIGWSQAQTIVRTVLENRFKQSGICNVGRLTAEMGNTVSRKVKKLTPRRMRLGIWRASAISVLLLAAEGNPVRTYYILDRGYNY